MPGKVWNRGHPVASGRRPRFRVRHARNRTTPGQDDAGPSAWTATTSGPDRHEVARAPTMPPASIRLTGRTVAPRRYSPADETLQHDMIYPVDGTEGHRP